ncbi:hypothetical protein OG241_00265 [Streptomyces sp. NBC_01390]|uniref:hypothetical protein n=1 Tax=Streptomyces sp. NBC_01390 TaxID=2903850 RepID=UPI00324849C9
MDVATWATLTGLPLAAGAAYLALAPQRDVQRQAGVETFLRVRRHLKGHWPELTLASQETPHGSADSALPLLTRPGWIPPAPLDPSRVVLTLRDAPADADLVRARRVASRYWPVGADGQRPVGYAAAITKHDPPTIWFDSPVYRLLDVGVESNGSLSMDLCLARYFEYQDLGEALLYEVAARHLQGSARPFKGPLRRYLGDPFVLARRCALPGINVVTVRVKGDKAFFFMQRRSDTGVGAAMNSTHVTPAGEFQPHTDALPVRTSDLNLWHTVMREYAEEFLGHPDASGDSGIVINYAKDRPFSDMEAARRSGNVRFRFLGIGINPLTWKPEICVACIWDASAFDRIFTEMLHKNDEGVLVVGGRRRTGGFHGLPFTSENILGYAQDPSTVPEGRACLALTWKWRTELGIPVAGAP